MHVTILRTETAVGRPLAVVGALVLLAASPRAQSAVTTLPHAVRDTDASSFETLPLGRTKCFLQTWYRGEGLVPGQVVSEVGWREENTSSTGSGTMKLEIVLDNNTHTASTLSATFAQNTINPTTFFASKDVRLPSGTVINPNQPPVWIPGDAPFVYQGPHFLMQVDNQTSATPTLFNYRLDGINHSSRTFEANYTRPGCGGTHHSSYNRGAWRLDVIGAAPNLPAWFLLGVDNHRLGPSQLPVDLGAIGLAGCNLELAPVVVVPSMANASGTVNANWSYTHTGDTAVVFSQAIHFDAANPSQLRTTRAAGTTFGDRGYCARLYNFNVFGPVAEFGPDVTNRAAVFLIR